MNTPRTATKPSRCTSSTRNSPLLLTITDQAARDEFVLTSSMLPRVVHDNFKLFDGFVSECEYITQSILCCLSDALNLEEADRLERSHRKGEPSNTTLSMLHYPQSTDPTKVGNNKHTDVGSLTLLFADQWGLQVARPETKSWSFIHPRAGHAIVNVGDTLRFLSRKQLNSCVHRVVAPAGGFQKESRYSIAYFLRPENAAMFEDAEGRKISAQTWHDDKYAMLEEPHAKQKANQLLMGGMETILT